MKALKYLFLLLLATSAFTACYEDEGNYIYLSDEEAGEIVIDTTGMANRYGLLSMKPGDLIEMSPNVTYRYMENLRYRWFVLPMTNYQYLPVQVGNSLQYPPADTIYYERELHWTVDLEPGQYRFYFMAEDSVRNMRAYFMFASAGTVYTEGAALEGLYMLSEYNGETDIDVYTSSLMLIYGGDSVAPRYYSQITGQTIPGSPRFIRGSHTGGTTRDGYLVATDQTMLRLNNESLVTMDTWDDMFYTAPDVFNPQTCYFMNNADFLINNGKLHVLYTDQSNDRKFSAAIAGDYEAAPFLAHATRTSWGAVSGAINADQIIYDIESHAFRPYYSASSSLSNFRSTSGEAYIDANNMVTDPIAIFNGYGDRTYCITEEEGVYYLYRFNFYNRVDEGDLSADGSRSKLDLSGCTDIALAKLYAANDYGHAFYYATDNAVHSFSPSSGADTSNTLYECEPGETVTALYTWNVAGFPTAGSVLWIAVWDENAQEGKLIEFEIDPNYGTARWQYGASYASEHTNPHITTGWGKIVSITCVDTE